MVKENASRINGAGEIKCIHTVFTVGSLKIWITLDTVSRSAYKKYNAHNSVDICLVIMVKNELDVLSF